MICAKAEDQTSASKAGMSRMTKRERELFTALTRLRDALWDADLEDSVTPRINRAYIAAGDLIAKINTEQMLVKAKRQKPTDQPTTT